MNRPDLQQNIDDFFGYFDAQHGFLCDLPDLLDLGRMVQTYGCYDLVGGMRLLQACAHMDALAHVAQRTTHTTREHFVRTVEHHSGIPGWALVSLPELWWACEHPQTMDPQGPRRALQELAQRPGLMGYLQSFAEKLAKTIADDPMSGAIPADSVDRDLAATQQLLSAEDTGAEEILQRALLHFTRAAILYRGFRCPLAHEARVKGETFDPSPLTHPPFYQRQESLDEDGDSSAGVSLRLVIPPPFVTYTLGQLIRNLRCKCRGEGIDPYQYFPDP